MYITYYFRKEEQDPVIDELRTLMKDTGVTYKDIAEKYRNDADAKTKIAEQIHKGGSGKWGPVIMPPFPQVTPEETKILTDWIMSRK